MSHEAHQVEWYRQGLALDGYLYRPADFAGWRVPERLEVTEDHLVWWGAGLKGRINAHGALVEAGPDMLDDFVSLYDASPEEVLRFAVRWGPLNLCVQHGKPITHVPARFLAEIEPDLPPGARENLFCHPNFSGLANRICREPLQRWRDYSMQARAMLTIAARSLKGGLNDFDSSLWSPLGELHGGIDLVQNLSSPAGIDAWRWFLVQSVDAWFRLGDVRQKFDWPSVSMAEHSTTFTMNIAGDSLFAALAVQIAVSIARRDALAICDGCGRGYIPKRLKKTGPHYCAEPRCKRTPKREWARRNRALKSASDNTGGSTTHADAT